MNRSVERLSIGDFSRLTWLSPKALRLYERRRLLRPDTVDEYTGYRYYRPEQAERARLISLLRRVGMPLERIAEALDAEAAERRSLMEAYRVATSRAHERAMALLDSLADELLDAPSGPGRDGIVVHAREAPAASFVSRSVRTTAADLPHYIERFTAELGQRAGNSVDRSKPLVVVYHGEVSWESDGPVEVRVPVSDVSATDGTEPSGLELFVEVPVPEVQFPPILRHFDAVREAAAQDARRPVGSPRELYLDGDPFRCQVAQRYTEASE